ncbi:LysR family transcriptional regulator [Steroidobacter sp. S1-65]|uniref:LysR family transcriptional regulator n=1 Tax=Steroidobacter gossypii TaxID=2805490 RepID=A0ABS1WZ80_9GAMM|nr:LysR substrate-binding domain-containing protein [Steroidobacter gossypii]MBM0106280.1 LysR family transcriptional regulator [Steroidobacter gossypii]
MAIPNLRHLQAFHEVVLSGSISAAAMNMHLTQSAVTQAIAAIERYFGASLFTRTSSGMQPTPAGAICADRIARALGQLRDGIQELAKVEQSTAEREQLFRRVSGAQLASLTKLVEFRNFTHAARASGVSQPTMHRAARTLEQTLGATLFEKTSYGVVPTREAEKLSRRAHRAFVEISQAQADIDALRGRESGSTVIGAMPLARSFLLPSALIQFTREHAEHAVSIMEGTYEHLLAALQSGQADFLIGALRDLRISAGIVQEHLFDDPLSIVVRAQHPLARRRKLTAADLSSYPWIAPRATSPLRVHFDALFNDLGIEPPQRFIECNSLGAARAFLMEGDHMMLSSNNQVHYELQAGMLVCLQHPAGTVVRNIGLTVREDWRPTQTQGRLLTILRETAQQLG